MAGASGQAPANQTRTQESDSNKKKVKPSGQADVSGPKTLGTCSVTNSTAVYAAGQVLA